MTLLTDNLIDTTLEESNYFTTGIQPGKPVFALYDMIADRFLIVLPNENAIRQLRYIVSSRYYLHICQLNVANNYVDGMITNSNCDNWSLSNRQDIQIGNLMHNEIVLVEQLCATREVARYNVFNEKLWCLFCDHCLYIVNNEFEFMDNAWSARDFAKLDGFLNSFLNITEVGSPYYPVAPAFRFAVLKLLYSGRDFAKTESSVKKLVKFI